MNNPTLTERIPGDIRALRSYLEAAQIDPTHIAAVEDLHRRVTNTNVSGQAVDLCDSQAVLDLYTRTEVGISAVRMRGDANFREDVITLYRNLDTVLAEEDQRIGGFAYAGARR